jgi:hypothetical protein
VVTELVDRPATWKRTRVVFDAVATAGQAAVLAAAVRQEVAVLLAVVAGFASVDEAVAAGWDSALGGLAATDVPGLYGA